MAKAVWVLVNPEQGSGNATVKISSIEHLGRVARESNITFSAEGCDDVVRIVKQAGKPEYVTINSQLSFTNEGGIATISGHSNSKKLTFRLGAGTLPITIPDTYSINGEGNDVLNGSYIPDDPGAHYAFNISLLINVPKNTTFEEHSRQVVVTTENGNSSLCTIKVAGDKPYLIVEDSIIELDYLGTAVSINVQSNTTWNVE